MSKRKTWLCDFKDCSEIAEWYMRFEGRPVKLCLRHYKEPRSKHWGKPVDFSELRIDEIEELEEKDRKYEKKCGQCGFINQIPSIIHLSKPPRCEKCGNSLFP